VDIKTRNASLYKIAVERFLLKVAAPSNETANLPSLKAMAILIPNAIHPGQVQQLLPHPHPKHPQHHLIREIECDWGIAGGFD
jgi:hypothetical protein